MGAGNYIHVECKIVRETDKAFLIEIDEEEIWVPKSQVADPDNYQEGDIGTVSITKWFCDKEGIEDVD